jgi:hypothetical protein
MTHLSVLATLRMFVGGWVTDGEARQLAADKSRTDVVAVLSLICRSIHLEPVVGGASCGHQVGLVVGPRGRRFPKLESC